ncbi:MAG: hypothetical protein V4584_12920 [Verrucomicrobiota bacterium]
MNQEQIENFQRISPQLQAFHVEFEGLTKKSANSALNAFKLRIVNQTIADANEILGDDLLPIRDFAQFNDSELPSNSDVSMFLSQYLEAMEVLRIRNIDRDSSGRWHWIAENGEYDLNMQTFPPRHGASRK